jgi:hypothetical protein
VRTAANFGLTVLLTVAILWGGCLSCSQLLPPAKCCHTSSHCGKMSAQKPPVAIADPTSTAEVALPVADIVAALAVPPTDTTRGALPREPKHSPPDLCLLLSVFRT